MCAFHCIFFIVHSTGGWPEVFCRELGYAGVTEVAYASTKQCGIGDTYINFHYPSCTLSSVTNFSSCASNKYHTESPNQCTHNWDVYLCCERKKYITLYDLMCNTSSMLPLPLQSCCVTTYMIFFSDTYHASLHLCMQYTFLFIDYIIRFYWQNTCSTF